MAVLTLPPEVEAVLRDFYTCEFTTTPFEEIGRAVAEAPD